MPLNRLNAFASLTPAETAAITALGEAPVRYARREVIRAEGICPTAVYLLLDGWVAASMLLPDGSRQILKVHLPGDIIGAPSMCLATTAETLTALSDAVVSRVALDTIGRLFEQAPRVAALLFLGAQQERVRLMDMIASLGRTSAKARIATLLLDLFDRLSACGRAAGHVLDMPLTQEQIGDLTGMSSVHVSRTMSQLERLGLIARSRRDLWMLHDLDGLRRLSSGALRIWTSNPAWLPRPLTSST